MSIVLDGTTGITAGAAVRADNITDVAGTGAPDFPNGFTVNGQASVTNESQILLNRPATNNYYLNGGGVYIANFTGGAITGSLSTTSGIIASTVSSSLIPVMSGGSTSSCSNGSVVCTVSPVGYSALYNLFDGGASYFDQYTSNSMTVTVDLGATVTTESYSIDRFANYTYQPRTWTFQGSANNSTWVTLDSYNSATDWGAEILTRSVAASYRYFRWVFSASNGNPGPGYVIDELILSKIPSVIGTYTSEAFTAASAPTTVSLKARINTFTTPISGSTLTLAASRDNGTTWTTVPFTVSPTNHFSDKRIFIAGQATISSQPSGTQMRYRLTSTGASFTSIDAIVMEWE